MNLAKGFPCGLAWPALVVLLGRLVGLTTKALALGLRRDFALVCNDPNAFFNKNAHIFERCGFAALNS